MKQIHTAHQLIAIVLIAWFVAPICCCSGTESEVTTRSCCQPAGSPDNNSDDNSTPQCPCGKHTLVEGHGETGILVPSADSLHVITASESLSETIAPPGFASRVLPQFLDLPPPNQTWFAISGSWLL